MKRALKNCYFLIATAIILLYFIKINFRMTITVALLGGGNILLKIFEWLSQQEYVSRVDLITAPRHSEEILSESGMRFYDRATEISKQANNRVHASFLVVDTLDDSSVAPILSSSDIAFSISAAWIFKKRHIDFN